MQVSRQTFQNIIDSARKKVAIALTNGNAINISGGDYTTHHCRFKCLKCGENYHIKYEQDRQKCPHCGSNEVLCIKRSEEHTSELQSRQYLVCRLLLEKKKK